MGCDKFSPTSDISVGYKFASIDFQKFCHDWGSELFSSSSLIYVLFMLNMLFFSISTKKMYLSRQWPERSVGYDKFSPPSDRSAGIQIDLYSVKQKTKQKTIKQKKQKKKLK